MKNLMYIVLAGIVTLATIGSVGQAAALNSTGPTEVTRAADGDLAVHVHYHVWWWAQGHWHLYRSYQTHSQAHHAVHHLHDLGYHHTKITQS